MHYLDRVQAILGLHDVNSDTYPYVVKQLEGDIYVLEAHFNTESHDSHYRQKIAKALARKLYSLGNSHRNAGKTRQARQAYIQTLRWPGRRLHALFRCVFLLRPW